MCGLKESRMIREKRKQVAGFDFDFVCPVTGYTVFSIQLVQRSLDNSIVLGSFKIKDLLVVDGFFVPNQLPDNPWVTFGRKKIARLDKFLIRIRRIYVSVKPGDIHLVVTIFLVLVNFLDLLFVHNELTFRNRRLARCCLT